MRFTERLEYCDINHKFSGICKAKNFYIDPVRLYPEEECQEISFKERCHYGP